MNDEFEYHNNKKPGKTYHSKSLSFRNQENRKFRYASKVFSEHELNSFALEKGEHVIRITPGGKQEIIAKFYEDNRGIFTLTIQRFTVKTGIPHKTYFTFVGEEIDTILEFINNIQLVDLSSPKNINVTDKQLEKMILNRSQAVDLINHNQDLMLELAKSEITKEDIIALGYRKKQLERFEKLLTDPDYFNSEKREYDCTEELLWQKFFEKNKWVFGYGLSYVFLSGLDDKKLEQVVIGYDLSQSGKRIDAVMKTRGLINSFCFVEIKTHNTVLLKKSSYRSACWPVSDEISGAVSQVQGTVEKAVEKLPRKLEFKDKQGNPTGECVFNYQPKSYLVVGNLSEFKTDYGINQDKYRSFELYRKNIRSPEIITFDELHERAKFIVKHSEV
ncbi:DUF4263 domain-containing protein [bacterium]|jgi:hypothetical protein|nr:DUF4263 domain-containing protein [bacterium]